jgi:hypothetical protein
MRKIDTSKLSNDECWAVQINGLQQCETCKFTGLTACVGQEIKKTGINKKGFTIGKYGLTE